MKPNLARKLEIGAFLKRCGGKMRPPKPLAMDGKPLQLSDEDELIVSAEEEGTSAAKEVKWLGIE